jgi:single-strand DNA-binding protein
MSEVLARHDKGDMIAVSGKLTKSAWQGRDGVQRTGFSVLVDSIASARASRPDKAKTKRAEQFDAIPFLSRA